MSAEVNLQMRLEGVGDIQVPISDLVIAGLTGRDTAAVEAHVAELVEIGVERPSSIPLFYRVSASLLTTQNTIQMLGAESSGEVEFILFGHAEGMLVGVASDHTDRKVEAYSVPVSKQMCAKPVSPDVWRFDEVADHFDELILRSWAVDKGERRLYQEGAASGIRPPRELIALYGDGAETLPPGTAMYGGTFAAIGGVKPAERFELELEDPVLKRSLKHAYDIHALPIVT